MNGWIVAMYIFLAPVSIALVTTDLRRRILPNYLTLGSYLPVALFLTGAAASTAEGFEHLKRSGMAALVVLLVFTAVHLIRPAALGMGDVKLAPIIGAVLGWQSWLAVLVGLTASFVLAGLVAAVLLISKRVKLGDELAFGPFLLAGMWLFSSQIS